MLYPLELLLSSTERGVQAHRTDREARYMASRYPMIYLEEMMRFFRLHRAIFTIVAALMLFAASVWAQGNNRRPSGYGQAPHIRRGHSRHNSWSSRDRPSSVPSKRHQIHGYYRFTNLPPGAYTITVTAPGFDTLKREGLILEVGHLPTVNLELTVGTVKSVVVVEQ